MRKNIIKNVIFLGKKNESIGAIRYLISQGIKVKYAVLDNNYDPEFFKTNKIIFYEDDSKLYKLIEKKQIIDIDLVISYLYGKILSEPVISLPRLGCVNFHPAPLPDYKGRAGYNTAILDKRTSYGVSAHYINSEEVDCGPIIKVNNFKISHQKENAQTLERKTQKELLKLFKEIIDVINSGNKIFTSKNEDGLYLTLEQLEDLKEIKKDDSQNDIDRKIRAFFFPPYGGAKIKIRGKYYTIVNEAILKYIYKKFNENI